MRALLAVVLSLGYERSVRLAHAIADLFYRVGKKHRKRALANIERALPEFDAVRRAEVARGSFRNMVRTFMETAWIPRLVVPGKMPKVCRLAGDPEAWRLFLENRGAVLVSGHFANWELTAQMLALAGVRLSSVARALDNPRLDRYVTGVRERYGMRIITKEGGVRGTARVLREGGTIAMLADQSTGRRGILVDFLGRPASTTPVPATMALRFGVPILLGRGVWTGNGNEYVLEADEPIMLSATGDREADVRAITEEINRRLERWVREYPEQWLWAHRRWKMRRDWFREATDES